ncbi:unnamed protein product [Caenorhabditis angaria]|uniref:diacylglycerol cholinephosphotransferase n=1 Tax=Caenorhabditis angaria TaxID=860376 RepID=A0A9P1J2E9_9PELO|nr:unnamed protein product [Caenorhabditis angaria]
MSCCISSKACNISRKYLENDSLLTDAELKRLKEHKYSAVDNSWLDELCMKRWWEFVITLCPMWIAPNLITLIGLIINLITVLILSSFSYSATEPAPWWAYVQAALGLFFYQTLDAIDGKQARRTGSSSPLGELFDHGCDSMTQVFVTLNICYAMSLGSVSNGVLAVSVISVIMFYCAHWSTYCTGQLRFSKFDVTEAQMSVISVLLFTALFGNYVWETSIGFGYSLKHAVIFTSVLVSIYQIGGYMIVIFSGGVGKNGSTIAGTSVLSPLFPLLMVILPFMMIYSKTNSSVFDDHITLFSLCFGAVGAKATNRLVIAHMSKSELRLWDWIYVGPLALMLNQYYDYAVNEYYLLWAATIYCYASLFVYCTVILIINANLQSLGYLNHLLIF